MTVLEAQVSSLGPAPESLSNIRTRNDDAGRPNKRRRVTYAQSLTQEKGLSQSGLPCGYIPIARFALVLSFSKLDVDDLPLSIPVWLRCIRACHLAPHLGCHKLDGQDDTLNLELATLPNKEVILSHPLTGPEILNLGENLELASSLLCADHYTTTPPTVCYKSTLHRLSDGNSFRLETVILWKDSLMIPDILHFGDSGSRAFSKYILGEEPDAARCVHGSRTRRTFTGNQWAPRDFYNNVHIPPDTPSTSADIENGLVESQLYPFQRRAVRWLLEREGMQLQSDGRVVPLEKTSESQLPVSFQQVTDADGRTCFASPLFMTITTGFSGLYDIEKDLKGGVLAEEMGLGKTIEMISLISLHRRPLYLGSTTPNVDSNGLRLSGTTLIITPPAILEQWKQEIARHSPTLHVFHYEGLRAHSKLSDKALIEKMSEHEIVLTTYNVLAREIYHSVEPPKRNMRHEKRFESRKSPLVQVSWWRVCLDEAQMVENGVSNAAQVARLVPRQLAWAVTGTPVRKDISDLFGLLLFLNYQPFCLGGTIWNRLCTSFQHVFKNITSTIALRHNKDRVRSELRLQPQKRVVITVPFTAIEEQHYAELYEQMCKECGFDASGAPDSDDFDPDDVRLIEKMRSWLTRLRQTCLHPEVATKNRRVLGTRGGPLRSIAEVLEVMIEQNDTQIRAEERSVLQSQVRRGQLLENAALRREALELWMISLERASQIVKECRDQLKQERRKSQTITDGLDQDTLAADAASDSDELDKNSRIVTYRQRLRAALEIQHMCKFFTGNAYYQIKTDPALTEPESEEFESLEKQEIEAYEAAKLIRKEMLTDISRKVDRYLASIRRKTNKREFVHIPTMKPRLEITGIESRRVFDKLEDFCDALNRHTTQFIEWRDIMIKLLSLSLIDQEEDAELEGNEYEKSTKHQDEMYVYMEALRAMYADRHDALTGQKNVLIAHEVKVGIIQAQKGEGPSPQLFRSVMATRSDFMPDPELGSLRGIITELRSLATSLDWQASGGSSRAHTELEIVDSVLEHASKMAADQGKVSSNLEREVEMFRDTMNNRLEYYRQLQQISDTVAPYDEESVGKPLDQELYSSKLDQERKLDRKISALTAKRRYLLHLRDESGSDENSKICIICQSSFEVGVLTVCGHKYCKDCLRMWWNQHRTCPVCKRRLKVNDCHQITYKPRELIAQEEKAAEEKASDPKESDRVSGNSIYTDISSRILQDIKDIDLNWSYGTKIDTLARHIIWLREHDPGAKAIVFSQYKSFLGVLGSAFARFKIGYCSVDHKDGIEQFKSDPSIECFLLHAKAHSSGLNLVNATHVFLCEPLINTAIELQAIARVHRIGQQRPTTVWMYLVSDTVEESIYDISVSRRLAHVHEKEQEVDASETLENSKKIAPDNLHEVAIDSANSMEMQDASLAKLLAGGPFGGEIVKTDDLWQCLFGNANRKGANSHADGEVARFLRGEAAEQRKAINDAS